MTQSQTVQALRDLLGNLALLCQCLDDLRLCHCSPFRPMPTKQWYRKAKTFCLVRGIFGELEGSALGLTEKGVEFAAGRVKGTLPLLRAVMEQGAAVLIDYLAQQTVGRNLSQRRSSCRSRLISPPSSHRLSTCLRMVFRERLNEARCAINGRKHASSCSPGGRSLSNPIHERGQSSRSRQ